MHNIMQSKLGRELGLFQIGAGIKKYKKQIQ